MGSYCQVCGKGTMNAQNATYGVEIDLETNAFTRVGYAFGGWAKTPGGAAVYADGASVSNLTDVADATNTLYAVWKANDYSVAFHANGGTGTMVNQTMTIDNAANLSANTFKRDGYTFLGWSTDKNATKATYSDKQKVSNIGSAGGSVTLYAVWSINKLSIHYNANSGTLASDSAYYLTSSSDIYASDTKTYVGNTWDWNYAGTNGLYNASTFKLTRMGYTFLGWSLSKTGGTIYDQDDNTIKSQDLYPNLKTQSGTILLYAQWQANTYTIKYDANTGTGSMDPSTMTYDKAANLRKNTFKKTGYTFESWSDGKETRTYYSDQQSVKHGYLS